MYYERSFKKISRFKRDVCMPNNTQKSNLSNSTNCFSSDKSNPFLYKPPQIPIYK